jgi:hypothetical protein
MGALSNSGRKAANLTGFYKGIQSAGAAVFWRLDGLKTPFDTMFGATVCFSPPLLPLVEAAKLTNFTSQWGLVAGSLVIAAPVIFLRIQDTVSLEEDLKFSDETVEDVAPARDVAVLNKESAV